ncbi:MAG TPA: metal ABC transporter substrate-binding protein [Acidimicrobiales bacterium]|nr:metal ABC transporter substrate-binding protein [Acidimicrobiales bacterium]
MGKGHQRTGAAMAVVLALAVACAGGGTGEGAGRSGGRRLSVVTTVAPITSIVANVAGEAATVTGLVPEGTNSHTFEPPPSAAKTLSQADVVFVNGLRLEEPTVGLARELANEGSEVVELGDRTVTPAEYVYDFSFPEDAGRPNPHLWTNPPMARQFARVAADTLERRDPANAGVYEANFERFAARVDDLDRAMTAATATLPPERRKLLTYHDAYAYFARHYGWTVIGAVQPSNFEEPTPKDVAALIEQVRRERVPAIFGSEVFPSPVLAQIGRETGVRYVDVLRDDDLPGKPGDPEHSWLGLMRFDFVTMVEALGGDASALRALDVSDPVPDRATYPQ